MTWRSRLADRQRAYTRPVESDVVWLSGTGPIRRRWRLMLWGWVVLSVPLRRVEWSRPHWVDPNEVEVVKFLPHNPPERGDIVLVDGLRMRVLACPVEWNGRTWRMKRGVKVELA